MTGDLFPDVRPVADEKPDDRYTTPATFEWCLRVVGFERFGRTRFGMPGNPLGVGVGSPPFACVLLIWRRSAP